MANVIRWFQVFCAVATIILSIPVLALALVIWKAAALIGISDNAETARSTTDA
jgi:hypothetical protein